MTNILVTGGAGYIGSHTCKALAKAGYTPITFDNLSTGHRYAVKWGPLVVGDLRDRKQLEEAFLKYQPVGVLHFAANALVIESMENPGKYYDNNISGSIALLETMRLYKVPYLVFSSTCATYGNPLFSPMTEEHPQNPINPYGKSKYMVEQIIQDFDRAYGSHSVCLRYFNAAGADPESEIGENHTPETHIIPSVIEAALGKRKELTVYGDGSTIRDYIHVEDLAKAHVAALKWLFTHNQSAMINLGTGTGSSIFDIINTVQTISQKKVPVRFEKKREGEPEQLIADNTKAQKLLGWTPTHSSLSNVIESAWKWHLDAGAFR